MSCRAHVNRSELGRLPGAWLSWAGMEQGVEAGSAPFPHPRQQEVLMTVAKKAEGKDWVEEDYFREFTRQALC